MTKSEVGQWAISVSIRSVDQNYSANLCFGPKDGQAMAQALRAWYVFADKCPRLFLTLSFQWPYSYDSCDVGTLPNQTYPGTSTPLAAVENGDPAHDNMLVCIFCFTILAYW